MSINVSVQYNGGLLPDTILLTQCYGMLRRSRRVLIFLFKKRAYSLEHKQCYNIVIGKQKYVYILQVRRDILLSV